MKKAFSYIVLFGMLILTMSNFSIVAVAKDAQDDLGVINLCEYDESEMLLSVGGTIFHDVMISHKECKLSLYEIPYGTDVQTVIDGSEYEPLASTELSVSFKFSVKLSERTQRFSRYAVVLEAAYREGELLTTPKHPSFASNAWEDSEKRHFKGVLTSYETLAADAGVGLAVVPVYIEQLLSDSSSGYLFSVADRYYYFDKNYVSELDTQIRTLSAVGARIYLQVLLSRPISGISVYPDAPIGASNYMPDVSDSQTCEQIAAFVDYLCTRYDDHDNGKISGLIMGSAVDEEASTWRGNISLEEFARSYAYFVNIFAITVHSKYNQMDLVIPIGNRDFYSDSVIKKQGAVLLLPLLYQIFEEAYIMPLKTSLLVESDAVPFDLQPENLHGYCDFLPCEGELCADNLQVFSKFLTDLQKCYEAAPKNYMYMWNVPRNITNNVLSCSYAYSYFQLLSDPQVSTFVTSFEQTERYGQTGRISDIVELMRKIDTSEAISSTLPQRNMLGIERWEELVSPFYQGSLAKRQEFSAQTLQQLPKDILGSFSYFDFTSQTGTSTWFAGAQCTSLKIEHATDLGRAMCARFSYSGDVAKQGGEILCYYEYPENFVYTPYLSFHFGVLYEPSDGENFDQTSSPLYEVTVILGGSGNSISASTIVESVEDATLTMDISRFNDVATAEYIRIRVRCLTGESDGYALYIGSITGWSAQHSSTDLENLIAKERLRIRDQQNTDGEHTRNNFGTVMIIIGISAVLAVVGIGVFMCFRRDDEMTQEFNEQTKNQ